jgi:hypothetical protein
MTNFLRYPEFLSLPILDSASKQRFTKEVAKLILERPDLSESEIDQLRRMIDYMNSTDIKELQLRKDFASFITEYDIRRGTNFNKTFPELTEFYQLCQQM